MCQFLRRKGVVAKTIFATTPFCIDKKDSSEYPCPPYVKRFAESSQCGDYSISKALNMPQAVSLQLQQHIYDFLESADPRMETLGVSPIFHKPFFLI